ncbi:MAG: LytR/AlgR family response regulator transcription factor [Bacillota bacterium]
MKRILVIEDEEFVRTGIEELLKAAGYKVLTASNGIDGYNLAESAPLDLIICDIMMPKQNGYDLKYQLNANPKTSSLPFIFLTAKADMKDLRYGMELGADDYIVKPFEAATLLNAIKARLCRFEQIKNKSRVDDSLEEKTQVKKYRENDRIFININNTPHFIRISEIKSITSLGNYTRICLASGESILHRKSMGQWEKLLPEQVFLRIHRTTIINLNYIERITRWSSGSYLLYLNSVSEPFIISQRYSARIRKNENTSLLTEKENNS